MLGDELVLLMLVLLMMVLLMMVLLIKLLIIISGNVCRIRCHPALPTSLTLPHTSCFTQIRRFYRPEDVGSKVVVYTAEWWEVYSGPEGAADCTVDVDKVVGKCSIKLAGGAAAKKPGAEAGWG